MANIYYLYILVTCGVFVDGNKVISGLYCKDPDTGKLYELNSTWPSTSFCGNYTCKLSKKNITNTEYAPITNINITNYMNDFKSDEIDTNLDPSTIDKFDNLSININDMVNQKTTVKDEIKDIIENDMTISPSELSTTITGAFYTDLLLKDKGKQSNNTKEIDKDDRYLTDEEIKTITNILHTVKKSDLEAIVDIYNLAQEIYNEIDSTKKTPNNVISQSISNKINSLNNIKEPSYWYNPNNPIINNNIKIKETVEHNIPKPYTPYTYFKAPLSTKDFRILPYYYPISDYQRMSSYRSTKPTTENVNKMKPCSKQRNNTRSTPMSGNFKSEKNKISYNKKMQIMLPYPFSNVNRYNQNAYTTSFYYNNYPWAQLTIYNKKKNYIDPYLGAFPEAYTTYPTNIKTVTSKEGQLHKKENILTINKSDARNETQKLPKWQTEPLSSKVLDEVKAKLDKKKFINLFPRKNVKLEKVGKVIKIDEKRQKRQAGLFEKDNPVAFEVQLQKIECITGSEPGYFSYGNLSEPYPACCPHKINN